MTNLDEKIREALRAEDQDIFETGEPGMRELVAETFRGKLRLFTWMTMFMVLVFFVLQIVTAVLFFRAEVLEDKILWATAFLFCGMAVGMLKMWNWMQMDKISVLREIKRLELQVARLSASRGQGE